MIHSMTGYAAGQGSALGYRWSWELRSVNGRGLDLRLRVPDWIEGLEASLRALLGKSVTRGNVSVSLRVQREDSEGGLHLNTSQLDDVIGAMSDVEARAMEAGLSLAPATAADIVGLRGILEYGSEASDDTKALKMALEAEFKDLIVSFNQMRAHEGQALQEVLTGQLAEMERLTTASADLLDTRQSQMAETFHRNLARVMEGAAQADPDRVAQELALLVVKADVTEEIDRLRTHIKATSELLQDGGAIGRKLDFLMQEFNREANTLCSKAQMKELTEQGLALKVLIDQMREQIQNVE